MKLLDYFQVLIQYIHDVEVEYKLVMMYHVALITSLRHHNYASRST